LDCLSLFKRKKMRPLEYMCLYNGDHAFVVIGRLKDGYPSETGTWGSDAVVCDPWACQHGQAYPASQIQAKMGPVIPRLVERLE